MADVFLSYKSEDRALVETLARALEREGVRVWWDRKISAGGAWRETIVSELRAAKVVIAAWSKRTEDFNEAAWVLNEVDEAARLGKPLIPVLLEPCEAPFGYRHVQAADLSTWRGEPNHPEWRDVQAGLRAALSGRRVAPVPPSAAPRAAPKRNKGGWMAPVLVSLTLAGGAYAMMREDAAQENVAIAAAPIVQAPTAEPNPAPITEPVAEREPRRRFDWFGGRPAAEPATAANTEFVRFVGRGDVRGTFRRTRGDLWLERNSEAGRAGFYQVLRIGERDIELYDQERDLYALIDLEAEQISIKSRGEDHYHARYRIAQADAAPRRTASAD